MSNVYLVIVLEDGRRGWFVGTDSRINKFQQPVQVPLFDDEKSKLVSLEFALDARSRWREFCQHSFKSDLYICLEKYGEFVEDIVSPQTSRDNRTAKFVPFTNGLGLIVTPGRPPTGPCWFVKASDVPALIADERHTAVESVCGSTPEEAAQRAVDMWGQEILFADPEAAARAERDRQQKEQEQVNAKYAGVRPADRR